MAVRVSTGSVKCSTVRFPRKAGRHEAAQTSADTKRKHELKILLTTKAASLRKCPQFPNQSNNPGETLCPTVPECDRSVVRLCDNYQSH